jgi:hypothetical protein
LLGNREHSAIGRQHVALALAVGLDLPRLRAAARFTLLMPRKSSMAPA